MSDYNDRLRALGEARYRRIKRMRERGMTLQEIGGLEGCSRQCISKILQRDKNRKAAK